MLNLRVLSSLLLSLSALVLQAQVIKFNVLAPVSVYSEVGLSGKNSVQLGLSFRPDILTLHPYSEFSGICSYRKYPRKRNMPQIVERRFFPGGKFKGIYLKGTSFREANRQQFSVYVGLETGRLFVKPVGKNPPIVEWFAGVGMGTPMFNSNRFQRTLIDVRLGLSLGRKFNRE